MLITFSAVSLQIRWQIIDHIQAPFQLFRKFCLVLLWQQTISASYGLKDEIEYDDIGLTLGRYLLPLGEIPAYFLVFGANLDL